MALIPWIQASEGVIAKNDVAGRPDVANRPLRTLLSQSGYDPDGDGLDLRSIVGNFTAANNNAAANATITGARNPAVTGAVIIVKFAAVANGPSVPNGVQCGAFGIEATGANWTVDAPTAAFVQIIPTGQTTLSTVLRIEGSSINDIRMLPKFDNVLRIGDDLNDGQPGNTFGRRLVDVRAYALTAVGAASIPILRGERINAAGGSPLNGDAILEIDGRGWTGTQYVNGGYVSFNATENWNATNWGTQMRVALAPVGGGVPTVRFVFNADIFRGAVDNTQDIGLAGNRIKNVFGYVGDFTTKINIANTQVVATRRTGWTAWTGTAARGTQNADAPPTLTQVAQAVKALIDDLTTHGLIGA